MEGLLERPLKQVTESITFETALSFFALQVLTGVDFYNKVAYRDDNCSDAGTV